MFDVNGFDLHRRRFSHSVISLSLTEGHQDSNAKKLRSEVLYWLFVNVKEFILIRSNEMQQYAGVYLLQNYSTFFECLSHPSSGVNQTVTVAPGTGHITCQSNNLPPAWPN